MILNMHEGRIFLEKEFKIFPRVGWQLDPFGHSETNAKLFAELGLETIVFARSNLKDHTKRVDHNEM